MARTRIAWLAALTLVLAACGPAATPTPDVAAPTPTPDTTPAPPDDNGNGNGDATVELSGFAFVPGELTVSAGTTVTFVNEDSAPHTATHGSDGQAADGALFDISLAGGESGEFTFDEPGTYEVTCRLHPTMNMTITVEG